MGQALALFQIADEYLDAANRLADLDLDDQTVHDTLEGLAGAVETKAVAVASFIRNLEVSTDAIKEAEERMAARRKAIQNRADSLREYLKVQMIRTGIQKVECPYFKLAIRDNPPAVVIDAPGLIPEDYMRTPEPPPSEPDKALIAKAIKDGHTVPGAHVTRGKRLEIK